MRQWHKRSGAVLLGAGVLAGGLLAGAPARAQDDLRKDVEELKQMLQSQARPAAPSVKDVVFNLGANPTRGSDQAKLTLVEFTDFQ